MCDVCNFRYWMCNDCMLVYYDVMFVLDVVMIVDLVVLCWIVEVIVYVFVSFGLDDGRYVVILIEMC